ncbi:MAG: DeoR family transcriptional regulator [Micropruina sp.]|uniref:DeoR family transcriptional regulator n=1 Tax=Micropruina sp. TaxID=2737536 RepID=UPI0039E5B981
MLRMLRSAGVLSARELTASLGVSHMTVRRDIAALRTAGQVIAVAGNVRAAVAARVRLEVAERCSNHLLDQ